MQILSCRHFHHFPSIQSTQLSENKYFINASYTLYSCIHLVVLLFYCDDPLLPTRMQKKVVRLVTAALKAVLSAEQRWLQATSALRERKYLSVLQLLRETKRFISDATKRLAECR